MSSSDQLLRTGLVALAFSALALLSGCSSFRPVYGDTAVAAKSAMLQYAKPTSRIEQIIYQDLALKLGRTADATAPTVRVTASVSTRELTMSDVRRPSEQHESVVTAKIELLSPTGAVTYTTTRSASALYTTDDQSLAAVEAEQQAGEQAAQELAETVRLTLLGVLARPAA